MWLENQDVGRDLGIPAIGRVPWGTHSCQFYGSEQDLYDIIVPYFRAGLGNNEKCNWVACEPLGVDRVVEALSREVDDLERRVATGQLTIIPSSAWYRDETTDWRNWLADVTTHVNGAVADGYAGARGGGDLFWLGDRGWDSFMVYEQALTVETSGLRSIALCAYPLGKCQGSKMIDLLLRHHFALVKQEDWTLIEPSAQKRATAAVEQMNQALVERTTELRAALADLRGFSRWVTHDLRAPLRTIRGMGDLLAETILPRMDDDERHLFERIQASAARMDTLITDILAYSTARQNTALQIEGLDLEALAREAWTTLTDATGAPRVNLQIRPLPQGYGDRAMLRQVLVNLLGNAIKFTGKTPGPHVEVGALTMNEENVYYVRDNGAGFDPAYADKMFGAFERLHGMAEFGGSGLGLSIVKQIITRHGGRVWAEGTPGAGATFYFTLPEPGPRNAP
jgi:signal transduction histidine kinase